MSSNFFTFDTDAEAKLALREESKQLKAIALRLWDEYIGDYTPAVYVRTKKSRKGIKLGRLKRLDAFTWGIELIFRDELMYHDSYISPSEKKGHSIMLISEGWQVKKGKHKNIKNFGYHEGTDYISKVAKEFENQARQGITIEVNWANAPFVKGDRDSRKGVLK